MSTIRRATEADVSELLRMIIELAEYEHEASEVEATEELLRQALFGPEPSVFAHVVEVHPGVLAGFALWFLSFSTWLGRHGIYLEDLFVRPAYRGQGLGKALLSTLARECMEHGYGRLEWWVLDWNEPAIEFYRAHGATAMDEWTVYRVSGQHLISLSDGDPPA